MLRISPLDPFHELDWVIDYTNRRIDELEREIEAFLDSQPYAQVTEPNADGTKDLLKVVAIKRMPLEAVLITFEIAMHLRSALDRAGYTVASAAGASGKYAAFPFGDTLAQVESRTTGDSRQIPKDVFNAMVALKPYEGGNDLLWGLNKLANTHKHEILVPHAVVAAMGKMIFYGGGFHVPTASPVWDSAKNEMIIAEMAPGHTLKTQLQVAPIVLLGDVKGIGGKPAIPTLRAIAVDVRTACQTVLLAGRRMGLPY